MKSLNPALWISNISNRHISLTDLNLTVRAYSSVNLLDSKHHRYTQDQIQKSIESGSIFSKLGKIVVRKIAPETIETKIALADNFIPSRGKSVYVINQEKYEELDMSDEQFAEENAETAELDQKPLFNRT